MSNNGDVVTRRALGAEIGKSHVWVTKLIKAGVIPVNDDGTIPHRAALEAYAAWKEGRSDSSGVAAPKKRGRPPKKQNPKDKAQEPQPVAMADIDDAVSVGMTYNKAKAKKEAATANLRTLEYLKLKGELVEKKEVELMAMQLAEKVRGKLMTVGVRVAGLCEGRTAREIEEIIDTEINSAMAELRKDWTNNI